MTFQLTGVGKALGSVKRITKAGHRVVFDEDGSFIVNKATGEVNALREKDNAYVLDLFVVPYQHSHAGGTHDGQPTFVGHCRAC